MHQLALNPFSLSRRIAAYKARALHALRADSSLSVRLARYNAAMAKARELEARYTPRPDTDRVRVTLTSRSSLLSSDSVEVVGGAA